VQFLSDEWTVELERRLNESDGFRKETEGKQATIQNVIETPEGQKRYWLKIGGGPAELRAGDATAPDATIEQEYETAAALARSELNPVGAFMSGKLRINGSMMLLMQLQGALSELAKVMQEMDVDY
jgi:putative sterol carrier protein